MNIVTRGYGGTPSDVIRRGLGGSQAAIVANQDAGSAAGRRHVLDVYRVTLNGKSHEFRSYNAAVEFIEEAKAQARKIAQRTVKRATDGLKSIPKAPKITVSAEKLEPLARQVREEIDRIYLQAALDAEIALLFAIDREQENESIMWMM